MVEEANTSGNGGETGDDNPFQDFGNGLKEDYNTEGGGRVVGGLAGFVEDHPVRHLH